MPEIEFLPAWYPEVSRKRRVAVVQAYMTIVLAAGLLGWLLLARHNMLAEAAALGQLSAQVTQKSTELRELDEQERLKDQLVSQQRVLDCLGVPVDAARILHTVEKSITAETTLTHFELSTADQPLVISSIDAARNAAHAPQRRLHATIDGVAPSNGDIVRLLAGLTDVPFFQDVALAHSMERSSDGRVMRDFEISFWMSLDEPGDFANARTGR